MSNPWALTEYQKEIDQYLQSAVRLYGHIPPRQFLLIFNRFHKDHKLSKDDLVKWMNKLNRQSEVYRIYTNAIINITVSEDVIDRIIYLQSGKTFRLPDNESDFLKWADVHYLPGNTESEKLSHWLLSVGKVNPLAVHSLMEALFHSVLMDEKTQCQADIMSEYHVFDTLSMQHISDFYMLFSDFSNHSIHWANCGYTPDELFCKEMKK